MLDKNVVFEDKIINQMDKIEQRKEMMVLTSITLVSCVFIAIFGLHSFLKEFYSLSVMLLISFILNAVNLVYYYYTKNYSVASIFMGVSIVVFCLYLVVTGGYLNSGPIWIFPLLAIAIFINRWKTSLFLVSCFFLGYSLYFWGGQIGLYQSIYSFDIIIRYTTSLLALAAACLVLGYAQEKAHNKMNEMHKKLEYIANTDSLTGLYNRHFVSENFIKNNYFIYKVCKLSSLLLIDIDHFKKINDQYGHGEGDKVLKLISDTLYKAVRDEDVITRWGGEEFLIILRGAPLDVAYRRAEKFRKLVENLDFTINGDKLNLTVSIGVSIIDDNHSASEIINQADEKLYQAKDQGRNKVC